MPIRTTDEAVEAIIDVDEDIELTPFIAAASSLVDYIAADDAGALLADSQLLIIETWLSAHFYAVRESRLLREEIGEVRVTYQSKVDLNLAVTHYGQMAMTLDTSGVLKNLNNPKSTNKAVTAGVYWLGTDPEEE